MIDIMRMEKKQIRKEDGRYLVYYHFPESASPEETGTFAAVEASDAEAGDGTAATAAKAAEEQPHV